MRATDMPVEVPRFYEEREGVSQERIQCACNVFVTFGPRPVRVSVQYFPTAANRRSYRYRAQK
jgi:hypothetical protein